MIEYKIMGDGASGVIVSPWTDDPILAQKRSILQHFLAYHAVCKITRGAHDPANWDTPLAGCARLIDGDQPLINDTLTRTPDCATHAICGPLTPGGVLHAVKTFDGCALACLEARDAEGEQWARRFTAPAVTLQERAGNGALFFYLYRLQDTPGGEELPAGALRAPGKVTLHTRGAAVPLVGTTTPEGVTIGPWDYQWGFYQLDAARLQELAALVQSACQNEAAFVTSTAAPAPTTATAAPPWELAAFGVRVFPTNREKIPLIQWLEGGPGNRATTDRRLIEKWARRWPRCNWAIATGPLESLDNSDTDSDNSDTSRQLLVIDCDNMDDAAYQWMVTRYPELAKTAAVNTGRDGGGVHLYTWAPPECTFTTATKIELPPDAPPGLAVDIKCRRACVAAPGSIHKTGRVYHWRAGSLDEAGRPRIMPAPAEWFDGRDASHLLVGMPAPAAPVIHAGAIDLARALALGTSGGASFGQRLEATIAAICERVASDVASQEEGGRNALLNLETFNLCRAYRSEGRTSLPDDVVEQLVQAATRSGLPEREARTCIRTTEVDVFEKGRGAAFTLKERPYLRGGQTIDWSKVFGGAAR